MHKSAAFVYLCVCVCVSVLPEDFTAAATLHPARPGLLHLDDNGTVCTRTQLQLEVTLQVNEKERDEEDWVTRKECHNGEESL